MKILAFMPVLNEADILPWTIRHMQAQGVSVHVLDGWSTDGSWEMLPDLGVTRERFPAAGPATEQACAEILRRIEDLASASAAAWCYLSDADEIRRSNRVGETLAEGIARVTWDGSTVIDHKVYAFSPVDDGYRGDPETSLRYCTDTAELLCTIPQQKLWQNIARVDLVGSGGHVVEFPGKRVAREKFILKHYPYRTTEQARERIRTRLARRCHAEHDKGWGIHYDALTPESEFLIDPAKLTYWRDPASPTP